MTMTRPEDKNSKLKIQSKGFYFNIPFFCYNFVVTGNDVWKGIMIMLQSK